MITKAIEDNKAEEIDIPALARETCLECHEENLGPDLFPEMTSISARFFYRFLPIPDEAGPDPEYVYIQQPDKYGLTRDNWGQYYVFVASWNNTWEAASARPEILSDKVPEKLRWVLRRGQNLRLVWRSKGHSYDPYAPLYHLLPRRTLERFGLQ
jgi:hypothetical protein